MISRPDYEAADLGALGLAHAASGEHRKAIRFYKEALAIYRVIDAKWGEGIYLSNLGESYTAIGKPRLAIKIHNQAIKINREVKDRRSEGYALSNWGRRMRLLAIISGPSTKALRKKTTRSKPDRFTRAGPPPRLLAGLSSWQIFHSAR